MEWMYLIQICIPLCCCLVAKFCPSLCNPMDSSVHVGHQAPLSMGFPRQEYWSGLPCPSLGGSSWSRDGTCVSCIGRQILYCWATKEALYSSSKDENTNFKKKNTHTKKAKPYLINPPNKPMRRRLVLACRTDEECRAWMGPGHTAVSAWSRAVWVFITGHSVPLQYFHCSNMWFL